MTKYLKIWIFEQMKRNFLFSQKYFQKNFDFKVKYVI